MEGEVRCLSKSLLLSGLFPRLESLFPFRTFPLECKTVFFTFLLNQSPVPFRLVGLFLSLFRPPARDSCGLPSLLPFSLPRWFISCHCCPHVCTSRMNFRPLFALLPSFPLRSTIVGSRMPLDSRFSCISFPAHRSFEVSPEVGEFFSLRPLPPLPVLPFFPANGTPS